MRNVANFSELQAFIADYYRGQRVTVKPYAYTMPVQTALLASGASEQNTLSILSNADFICTQLVISATEDSGTQWGWASLQLTDTASQENWFWNPAIVQDVCTNANMGAASQRDQRPGPTMTVPRVISANSSLVSTFGNNVSVGLTFTASLTLVGVNVFPLR